jgi:hypothetical protein
MAIALQRPDDARARPSSLMKRNDDYSRLFNPKFPIRMYFFCASLMRFVEEQLKADKLHIEKKDRNNIKYHVGMYIPALTLRKLQPSVDDLSQLSISELDAEIVNISIQQVKTIYEILGTTDRVAKGPEFLKEVKQDLAEQISLRPK